MASNPVFNRIEREAERGYAGFNDRGPQPPQPAGPWGATDQMTDRQLQDLYNQPAASPVQTGRLTLDDVVMKFSGLFALVLVFAGIGWALAPTAGPVIVLGGIAATLVLGLVIAFKKTISVPLIVGYAVVEGLLVGAVSSTYSNIFDQPNTPVFQGIVAQAVLATLSVFVGMLLAYKTGLIKVTAKFRRIMTMAIFGYVIFALVNLGYALITNTPFGIGGTGDARPRHLGLRGRPGVVLAGPRLRLDRAGHRGGRPREVLVAARARPDRDAGLALPRDPAPAGAHAQRLTVAPATSPVPQGVSDELRRVVRRWQQLPLDHALSCMPAVRGLLADLTDDAVPDLGPAVVMDQLTVLLYDACQAGQSDGLEARLADLRRALA